MDFQPEKESWDSYAERLGHFFMATNMVDDGRKVFTLIHQNGPTLYTLLKELCFPMNPTQMRYDEVMDVLRRHYIGAKNVYCERKAFYNARMKPHESATEWHRRLRALIIDCDFGGFVEEILVDKFVTGFQGKILQRLCEEDENLSLQQALQIAQRLENDLPSVDNKNKNQEKMSSECRQKSQQHQGSGHKGEVRYEEQSHMKVNDRETKGKQVVTCHKCGMNGHYANVCRSRSQSRHEQRREQPQNRPENVPTCYKCGKVGHYANVCRSRSQFQGEQRKEQPQNRPENVPTCNHCGKVGHYANVCRSRLTKQREEDRSECCIS